MNWKVFIVDDHQIVIDGLEKIIETDDEMELVSTASDGKEAVDKIMIFKPDLVLMDLDMPVMNGLEASKYLLSKLPNLKIIILTMHGEHAVVEKMMSLGISGYLTKTADKEELKFGMKQVLKGKKYFQSEAVEGFVRSSKLKSGQAEFVQLAQLSEREREVLTGVAQGHTNIELGEALNISIRTVETHRKNILRKLNINNIAGLVRFAIKAGLVS